MTWSDSVIDGEIPIPIYDGEGAILGQRPGYHLNIPRDLITPNIAAFEVTPTPVTPTRRFAGDPAADGAYMLTAFLRFADEAEARAVLGDF